MPFNLTIKANTAQDLRNAVRSAATAYGMRLIENTCTQRIIDALRDRHIKSGMVVLVEPISEVKDDPAYAAWCKYVEHNRRRELAYFPGPPEDEWSAGEDILANATMGLTLTADTPEGLRNAVLGAATAHGMRLIDAMTNDELLRELRRQMSAHGGVVKVMHILEIEDGKKVARWKAKAAKAKKAA